MFKVANVVLTRERRRLLAPLFRPAVGMSEVPMKPSANQCNQCWPIRVL
jgi:hypothetical protein